MTPLPPPFIVCIRFLTDATFALSFIRVCEQIRHILGLSDRHEHKFKSVASGVSDEHRVERVVETQHRMPPHRILIAVGIEWLKFPMRQNSAVECMPHIYMSTLACSDKSDLYG